MSRQKVLRLVAAVLAAGASPACWATGPGLAIDATQQAWPRWAARLTVATQSGQQADAQATAPRTRHVQLLGDYYVQRPRLGDAGGLRLTSGVLVGTRAGMLDPAAAAAWRPGVLTMSQQATSGALREAGSSDSFTAWPYLGVGYSAASLRGGWGFSADLGLAAQNPGGLRLGGLLGGTQGLDDALRELRLRPVLQMGVSYAF